MHTLAPNKTSPVGDVVAVGEDDDDDLVGEKDEVDCVSRNDWSKAGDLDIVGKEGGFST
jgi:hypothetical protein